MRTALEEINRAGTLANTLQDLIGKKGSITMVDGHRDPLLLSHWSLGFDLFKGMLTLMRDKFYSGGFALMRPLLEANLRAHLIVRGDKDDVEKISAGDYKMNFDTVGAQIDDFFVLGGYTQTLLQRYAKTFHGFTHSGLEQIARHYDGSGIGACYDEEEVIWITHMGADSIFMVNSIVTKYLKLEDEWKRTNDLFIEFSRPH